MTNITFDEKPFAIEDGESVVECLERNNIQFPSSCKSGACQSCLAQLTSGDMHQDWQRGLKDTYKAQNYFLPCIAKPQHNISLQLPNTSNTASCAIIQELFNLSYNVIAIRLKVENLNAWTPGQYLNLINHDDLIRSYSIANLPSVDGYIELHIKLSPKGLMSTWLKTHAKVGTKLLIRGPAGDCFYNNPHKEHFNMLLAATGTGLAPLIAIIREALSQHHQGRITLLHGGCKEADLYDQAYLANLATHNKNFFYHCCVLSSDGNVVEAAIDKELKTLISEPQNTKAYICGPEETAKQLKKVAFLAGIASKNIFSDLFIQTK